VGGGRNAAGAAGDLCAPPAAAMSPDNNHNDQPLAADQTPHRNDDRDDEENVGVVIRPQESESQRIFVGDVAGGAGLQGLLMVKVRKGANNGQGEDEVEIPDGDSEEVMISCGGTGVTDEVVLEVPQRRPILRRDLLGEEEEKLLQEYLKRSDTAIIFPEPVEQGT